MIKTKILIITLLLSLSSVYAQQRYMVYFKDKGSNQHNSLNKSSSEYKEAEAGLSKKAIERRKKVMGENYITYEDLPISHDYMTSIKNFGVEIHRELKWFNAVSCYLTDEQINQVILLPFVQKIEKVRTLKRREPEKEINEKDESYNSLPKTNYIYNYGNSLPEFELCDIPAVHDAGINGENVIIGILDSGFDWKNHPSLSSAKVNAEYDFVFNDNNTADEGNDISGQENHGTYVMSLIGGFDQGQIVGPSFNSQFVLAKTENNASEKNVEEDNYAAALEWMEGEGVDISTSSVGYNLFDAGERSYTYSEMNGQVSIVTIASNLAFERGMVTITSAGNERGNSWGYITAPADAFDIIAVGSVNHSNQISYFSSYGPTSDGRLKPEVVAQGESNYAANAAGGYKTAQGTSYSAPIVAGVAGMLMSAHPHLNNKQVRDIIIASGDNQSKPDNDRGYGLVSAVRAVNYPNLQKTTSGYTLHKLFLNKTVSNPSAVQIYYSVNGGEFSSGVLSYDGSLKYKYEFNSLNEGDAIEYYFTIVNNGVTERIPSGQNYLAALENLTVTTVDEIDNPMPSSFALQQNYPNPFNPSTKIEYNVPERSFVTLKIFNMLGQEIKTLVNNQLPSGNYTLVWNGKNNSGQSVSAGAYVYQMTAGEFVQSRKMILLK